MKKTRILKSLLNSGTIDFILEAHNGMSANIVEEAGFPGIWASGLTLSCSMGARDCNELSWTNVLDEVWKMADYTSVPILLDVDTGYGDFNNARYTARKFEQIGVAGICIEDKLFPKLNSFVNSGEQKLCPIDVFVAKIKAIKDTQADSDFCVIARTETCIVGGDPEEALIRANAYYEAGADAILMHSRAKNCDQIEEFMKLWHKKCPVVIVPTTYYTTPSQIFEKMGISLVIWANHMLRSAITSMQRTAKAIYEGENVYNIDNDIARVEEIFRLQRMDELQKAKKLYYA